jgi:hypothetical protein
VAGKLDVPGRLNAVAAGSLVYVTDQASSRRFLIDTGASFSILPHQSLAVPSGPNLSGPDGQPIACWGDMTLHLVFSGQQFKWTFLLADVKFPIIGVDFLRAHMLIVDPAAGRLVATATGAVLDAQAYPSGATASVVLPRSSAARFTAVERPGAAAARAASPSPPEGGMGPRVGLRARARPGAHWRARARALAPLLEGAPRHCHHCRGALLYHAAAQERAGAVRQWGAGALRALCSLDCGWARGL